MYICYAQTTDSNHPRIVLRKPRIRALLYNVHLYVLYITTLIILRLLNVIVHIHVHVHLTVAFLGFVKGGCSVHGQIVNIHLCMC